MLRPPPEVVVWKSIAVQPVGHVPSAGPSSTTWLEP
jgi:hypothetical protein